MAVGMVFEIPGCSQAQYDQIMAQLGQEPSPGMMAHIAGPMEGGWRVIDVWESTDLFQDFLEKKLAPALNRVGVGPLEAKAFPIHNFAAMPAMPVAR